MCRSQIENLGHCVYFISVSATDGSTGVVGHTSSESGHSDWTTVSSHRHTSTGSGHSEYTTASSHGHTSPRNGTSEYTTESSHGHTSSESRSSEFTTASSRGHTSPGNGTSDYTTASSHGHSTTGSGHSDWTTASTHGNNSSESGNHNNSATTASGIESTSSVEISTTQAYQNHSNPRSTVVEGSVRFVNAEFRQEYDDPESSEYKNFEKDFVEHVRHYKLIIFFKRVNQYY